jgi:DNA-binding response OmpR family regulator
MSASLDTFIRRNCAQDLRDEDLDVRVLLIEESLDAASLVERALTTAARGHFQVTHCPVLDVAEARVQAGEYDVLLVDVSQRDRDEVQTIETADALAHRLPVIVLTGTQDGALEHRADLNGSDDVSLLQRIARSALSATILQAIRQHRRMGACCSEPIICRVPDH